MNWEELQGIIRATDAQYAAGDDSARQAAVAARDSAVSQYQSYLSSYVPPSVSNVSSSPSPPTATPPSPWLTTPTFTQPSGIKQADPDIIIGPETDTTGDYIVERFFEELGGTELINISRYDLIDGADVSYKPIVNLSRLRRRFNPNNIIALDILSDNEFSKFSINLLSRGMNEPYFDDDGNLVVEVDIIRPEENIEVEISLSGTVTRIEL
jgi:hypothetical protein